MNLRSAPFLLSSLALGSFCDSLQASPQAWCGPPGAPVTIGGRHRDLVITPNGTLGAAHTGFGDGDPSAIVVSSLPGGTLAGLAASEGFKPIGGAVPPVDSIAANDLWIAAIGNSAVGVFPYSSRGWVSFVDVTNSLAQSFVALNTTSNEFPLDIDVVPDAVNGDRLVVLTDTAVYGWNISAPGSGAGSPPVQVGIPGSAYWGGGFRPVGMSDWIAVGEGSVAMIQNLPGGCNLRVVSTVNGTSVTTSTPYAGQWGIDVGVSPDGQWAAMRTIEIPTGVGGTATNGGVVILRADGAGEWSFPLPARDPSPVYEGKDWIEVANDSVISTGVDITALGPQAWARNLGRHRIDLFRLDNVAVNATHIQAQTNQTGYALDLGIKTDGANPRAAVRTTHYCRVFRMIMGGTPPITYQYGTNVTAIDGAGFDWATVDLIFSPCAPLVSDWLDISETRIAFYSAHDVAGPVVRSTCFLVDSTTLVGGVVPFVYPPNLTTPDVGGELVRDVAIAADDANTLWSSANMVVQGPNTPLPGFPALSPRALTPVAGTGCNGLATDHVGVDFIELNGTRAYSSRELLVTPANSQMTILDLTLRPDVPFCFGDGSGATCPCNNSGGPCEGCANDYASMTGAVIAATGPASISAGSLVLSVSQAAANQTTYFNQGDTQLNGGNGVPFGDGLRCVGGNVIRLQIVGADANGNGATTVNVPVTGGVMAGNTRHYQVWYRDPDGNPCGSTSNLSNGTSITWAP